MEKYKEQDSLLDFRKLYLVARTGDYNTMS